MKQVYFYLSASLLFFFSAKMHGQCPTDLLSGQNLVTNGEFTNGYSGWTFTADSDGNPSPADGYIIFNPPVTQSWSSPGFINAAANPNVFNSAFANFSDHSASADNNMLMVDGICSPGIKLWSQSGIPIKPNTNYYFSVWVHALKDNNNPPGTLRFDINGVDLGTSITAPTALASGWILFEHIWFSGAAPPATATISIENTTTTGCDQYVDFAIDDISFIPGCAYGAAGPQPDLGPDRTICGTGGSIVLNTNVTPAADLTVTWSDGTTGSGLGAPYTKTITAAGTYSVCVLKSGSCTKTDVIVISNTYSINLGPDQNLCGVGAVTLNAGYSGPGVTYLWRKDGSPAASPNNGQTYFVNTSGTYSVEVTDPVCGIRTDEIIITTSAPTAVNATFCPTQNVTLSVNPVNSGKYKWWNHPTASAPGNLVQKGGNTYTFSATAASNYTFYVEDTASFRTTIGPPLANATNGTYTAGPNNRGEQNETNMLFNVLQPIVIDSVWMYLRIGGSCPDRVGVEVWTSGVPGTLLAAAPTFDITAALGCATNTWVWIKVPVNIAVPVGTNYRLKFKRPSNAELGWWENGMTYPVSYASAVTFTGNYDNIPGWKPNAIPGMWRWVISAGTACARVPVQAIYNCPAPLNFLSFFGNKTDDGNKLFWSTSNELGTGNFTVMKSWDGIQFEAIGTVAAAGSGDHHYEFLDVGYSDLAYYKLTETDIDGQQFYSEVISVGVSTDVLIFPNPAEGSFTIHLNGERLVNIFDALGRVVFSKQLQHEQVSLSPGLYVVQVQHQGGIETREIIVK